MKTQRTRSQSQLLHLMKHLNREMSAQELHIELRSQGKGMGLATVYRALDALKLDGAIQVRTLSNGESLYSLIQQDQHHLTCLQCSRSIPISHCPVHELEHELDQEHQFKIYYHTLEFFGLCSDCQTVANER